METIMTKSFGVVMLALALTALAESEEQVLLEHRLRYGFERRDYYLEKAPVFVPKRYRNALPEFAGIISKNNWTTNQFIDGMICAITNNVKDDNWSDIGKQRIAKVAARKLSEIDLPAVTNFFRQFNESDNTTRLNDITIPAMFWRTNLEPEVMAYMLTLCARTNVFDNVEDVVMNDMVKTLSMLPSELKPGAANRVAKYIYFSIRHTKHSIAWQDRELSKLVSPYSKSVQRLSALRHVEATTANPQIRDWAHKEVESLSSIPTNQLNNISWIAEDVTGGK